MEQTSAPKALHPYINRPAVDPSTFYDHAIHVWGVEYPNCDLDWGYRAHLNARAKTERMIDYLAATFPSLKG